MAQSSTAPDVAAAWHAALERSSSVGELAAAVDERAGVVPWRHPDSPVPVRPVLLASATAAQVAEAGREVIRLAVQECGWRATEPAALAEMLSIEPSPLLTDRPSWNRWAASQARPDLVLSGGVPKVLECNIGSAIGGPEDTIRLDDVFWATEQAVDMARLGSLQSGRSIPARRELLVRMAHDRGVHTPEIAVAGISAAHFAEVVDEAAQAAVTITYVELADLIEDRGLRDGSGRKFDLFLQKFIAAGAYLDGEPMAALEAAVANDSTLIASPDLSSLLSSKKVLAWLTERADELPRRDRDLVLRYVPWTAVLCDGVVQRQGEQVDLLDLLVREQESFVVKPADAFGGHGVVVGCELAANDWRSTLNTLLDKSYVVQQYFPADSLPTSVWDEGRGELSQVEFPHVISPFVIDGRVEGCFARFSLPGQGAVASADRGGCNTVFVYD